MACICKREVHPAVVWSLGNWSNISVSCEMPCQNSDATIAFENKRGEFTSRVRLQTGDTEQVRSSQRKEEESRARQGVSTLGVKH